MGLPRHRGHGPAVRGSPRPVHAQVVPALPCLENVLQIEMVGREFQGRLARRAPMLPGADLLAFIDSRTD